MSNETLEKKVCYHCGENCTSGNIHLQEKIFEMFTSAKREGTAGEKSFGLGLSICRTIRIMI